MLLICSVCFSVCPALKVSLAFKRTLGSAENVLLVVFVCGLGARLESSKNRRGNVALDIVSLSLALASAELRG